jgi:hypothetical protein
MDEIYDPFLNNENYPFVKSSKKMSKELKNALIETSVKKYLKEERNWKKHFNKPFPTFDFPIIGCVSNKRIGSVDIVIDTFSKLYFIEIKGQEFSSEAFWGSLKILGYTASYKINQKGNREIISAIMIPKRYLRMDYMPILYILKLRYIIYDFINGEYEFETYL